VAWVLLRWLSSATREYPFPFLTPVALQVIDIGQSRGRIGEQSLESRLALHIGRRPHVEAVEIQKIEGLINEPVRIAPAELTPQSMETLSGGYSFKESFKLAKLLFAQPREIRQSPLVLDRGKLPRLLKKSRAGLPQRKEPPAFRQRLEETRNSETLSRRVKSVNHSSKSSPQDRLPLAWRSPLEYQTVRVCRIDDGKDRKS
jgi:hypothetical protein